VTKHRNGQLTYRSCRHPRASTLGCVIWLLSVRVRHSSKSLGRKASTIPLTDRMSSFRVVVFMLPLAAAAIAAAFVGVEHFNGGVKTHHFLARADLPGFSNWLSLLILPLLGIIVALRVNSLRSRQPSNSPTSTIAAGVAGSLAYGATLAVSFHFGPEQVSLALFAGLFLISVALPVYRAEYIFGFVTGMTVAFGSVIPLTFAIVFATVSFVCRRAAVLAVSVVRKLRR